MTSDLSDDGGGAVVDQGMSRARPMEIERGSMAIIDSEVPEPRPFSGLAWRVVRRMIHTTADFEMLDLARIHPRALETGVEALSRGCRVITDTQMARVGMPMRRLSPLGCTVECLMNDPAVAERAKRDGVTRALAAVDSVAGDSGRGLAGTIMVVGNAPTALIRLVEKVEQGCPPPALVVGMPVGFVNAAESKDLLVRSAVAPYVTVIGRKGGSALAASVVNALADEALARLGLESE